MTMLDDIRRDREAGTPGPWVHQIDDDGFSNRIRRGSADGPSVCVVYADLGQWPTQLGETNARRIARVPQMEAALLAAEELANVASYMVGRLELYSGHTDDQLVTDGMAALDAFRAAMEDTQ